MQVVAKHWKEPARVTTVNILYAGRFLPKSVFVNYKRLISRSQRVLPEDVRLASYVLHHRFPDGLLVASENSIEGLLFFAGSICGVCSNCAAFCKAAKFRVSVLSVGKRWTRY